MLFQLFLSKVAKVVRLELLGGSESIDGRFKELEVYEGMSMSELLCRPSYALISAESSDQEV